MNILITAGPTREYLDSVRFISNASSGKMGFAIAEHAARRGHEVHLVAGPVSLPGPPGVHVTRVISAAEMFDAATRLFERCRVAVMAAAVCDYAPDVCFDRKIKKQASRLPIVLVPTKDICAHLGRSKGDRAVIGFAMEDHDHLQKAEAKLLEKRCDAIVLNSVDSLAANRTQIRILRSDKGWSEPATGDKSELAGIIVQLAEELAPATQ